MFKKISIALILLVILSIYILAQKEENNEKAIVSVSEVKEKIENKEDILLLDVRTSGEFEGNLGHIEGATLIPLQELENRLDELTEKKENEIIVICRSGNRSGRATNILRKEGFNAFNMVGGMIAYRVMENKSEQNESEKESDKDHH